MAGVRTGSALVAAAFTAVLLAAPAEAAPVQTAPNAISCSIPGFASQVLGFSWVSRLEASGLVSFEAECRSGEWLLSLSPLTLALLSLPGENEVCATFDYRLSNVEEGAATMIAGAPLSTFDVQKMPLALGGGVSLIFCNPYFVRFLEQRDADTGLNTDTSDDISLGLSSRLSAHLTASAFSTLNLGLIRIPRLAIHDATSGEGGLHRFIVGLSLLLGEGIELGACAGALCGIRLEDTQGQVFLDLRMRF